MSIDAKINEIQTLLKLHYGYDDFRHGQKEAIVSAISGKDSLIIMPTGGGKSLCYQLPALILEGITIVISPLIALMKDQVDALNKIGIPATYINSSLDREEARKRIDNVKKGIYKILYIAPERFYNEEFLQDLKEIKVDLFAIDEAHCISHWGHDFRPSYLKLRYAINLLGRPTVMALTATATPEVKNDIIKQSGMVDPKIIITGFKRPNLQFGVIQTRNNLKPRIVLEAVQSVPDESGIIYVGTRNKADELMQALVENNIDASTYHAGMDPESRKWVQDSFMAGKIKVIVATNAFGMGIDKANIRFVIHYDLPGTIEAYYQEAGRAGRDGKPSFCLLLHSPSDRYLQEFFIKGDNPPPEFIKKLYALLLDFGSDTVLVTYNELLSYLNEELPEMAVGTSLKMLEQHGLVRRSSEKASNAFIKFNVDKDELLKLISSRAKKQIAITEKLNEKFKQEIFSGLEVNLQEVADSIKEKKESIIKLFKQLQEKAAGEYRPPFKGTEIIITKRIDPHEIEKHIDFTALREKQNSAYDKLEKMEGYVYHTGCRQDYILEYFGESDLTHCRQCDYCLTGPKLNQHQPFNQYRSSFREHEFEVTAPSSDFETKLTQLQTYDLYLEGLDIDTMAQKRNLKPATIIEHLCFLIKNGKQIEIEKFVEPFKIEEIKRLKTENNYDKLTQYKDKLGDNYTWEDIKLVLALP